MYLHQALNVSVPGGSGFRGQGEDRKTLELPVSFLFCCKVAVQKGMPTFSRKVQRESGQRRIFVFSFIKIMYYFYDEGSKKNVSLVESHRGVTDSMPCTAKKELIQNGTYNWIVPINI